MKRLGVVTVMFQAACWAGGAAPVQQPVACEPQQVPDRSPRVGRYMCQVAIDDRWDELYPCQIVEPTHYSGYNIGDFRLGFAVDFTGHHVEAMYLRLGAKAIMIASGTYHLAEHLKADEDYGYCVSATLAPEADGWVGVLQFAGCNGRYEPWAGTRRFAIRRRPWPRGFTGEMW